MLPAEVDFTWEDEVEDEIQEDIDTDKWESWTIELDGKVDDSWHLEGSISYETWNKLQYADIQAPGTNDEFDEYWREKMQRQRDGIT